MTTESPKTKVAEPAVKVATIPTPPKPSAHKEAVDKGFKVKNIHIAAISLESGIVEPGQTGFATAAEKSCLLGQYLEEA
jgi:hypothetical protein